MPLRSGRHSSWHVPLERTSEEITRPLCLLTGRHGMGEELQHELNSVDAQASDADENYRSPPANILLPHSLHDNKTTHRAVLPLLLPRASYCSIDGAVGSFGPIIVASADAGELRGGINGSLHTGLCKR